VPVAIRTIAEMGGGWPAVIARNHALVLAMLERLGGRAMAPPESIGTMAAIEIAVDGPPAEIEKRLLAEGWEIPIVSSAVGQFVRVSAHLYNDLDQIDALAAKLHSLGVRIA
jgi:selenocysteine lyase/cysteine desulfurase